MFELNKKNSVVLGAGIGIVFGAALGNPGVGMVLGAAAGLALSRLRTPPEPEQAD